MNNDLGSARLARWLSYIVGLILVVLPFHEFLVVWVGSNAGHLDLVRIWKEILITAMVPPVLWLVWQKPSLWSWIVRSWIVRLYLVYFLLHLGLGYWAKANSQVSNAALIYGLLINLRFIGFFLVCAVVAACDGWLKGNWQKIIITPASLVVAFALVQRWFLPYDFLRHFGYGPTTVPAYQTVDANMSYQRIQSTLRGANMLGAYLLLVIAALTSVKNNWQKWLLLGGSLAALAYSYSRSAWIGVVISLLILAYAGTRRYGTRLAYGLAVGAIVVACGAYILQSNKTIQDIFLHTSAGSPSKISSNSAHGSAIKSGYNDVARQPLGRGPGTAGPASFRNDHPARIAEDYYLQIGQEVGLEGLAVFIAINLLVAWQLWQRRADNLAKILLASLVGISFINLVSHAWTDDTLSLLWWGLAGIACAPVILKSNNKHYENIKTEP